MVSDLQEKTLQAKISHGNAQCPGKCTESLRVLGLNAHRSSSNRCGAPTTRIVRRNNMWHESAGSMRYLGGRSMSARNIKRSWPHWRFRASGATSDEPRYLRI